MFKENPRLPGVATLCASLLACLDWRIRGPSEDAKNSAGIKILKRLAWSEDPPSEGSRLQINKYISDEGFLFLPCRVFCRTYAFSEDDLWLLARTGPPKLCLPARRGCFSLRTADAVGPRESRFLKLAVNETLGAVFIKGPRWNLVLMKVNKGTALMVGI